MPGVRRVVVLALALLLPVAAEEVTLETQEDVERFATRGLTVVDELFITGSVSDLRPLANLTKVTSCLRIISDSLVTLDGLEGLTEIEDACADWSLLISGAKLTSVQALGNLRGPLQNLYVGQTKVLPNLEGLQGITSVQFELIIQENEALESLEGLRGLAGPQHSFSITDCPQLTSLAGLENVTSMFDLDIENLPRLGSLLPLRGLGELQWQLVIVGTNVSDLAGLEGITCVGDDDLPADYWTVWVDGNPSLRSFQGLQGLRQVKGKLVILRNPVLESLDGLEGLTTIGHNGPGESLMVFDNPALRSLTGLRGLSGRVPGSISVTGSTALASLKGLEGVMGAGSDASGTCLEILGSPSLTSVEGLGLLHGNFTGDLRITTDSAQVAGIVGLTGTCGWDLTFGYLV